MKTTSVFVAVGAVVALTMAAAFAGGKEEPKPSVNYAKSWEAAVEEAKTLNVPIVMHNHGFYCGPCWGMHAAVLHNDKYIAFAADNTVEVIAEQDLQKGMEDTKETKRNATYDAKDETGKPVKYMMEWPGLTLEQMIALHSSPAGTYNHTGGIPYTSIIDPYTLQEMKGIAGGGHSAKEVMEEVTVAKATLNKGHGPSLKRSSLTKFNESQKAIEATLAKSGPAAALTDFAKLDQSVAKEGDALKAKSKALGDKLLEAAKAQLDAADVKIAGGDVKAAAAIVKPLAPVLKGTDLETRVKELVEKTKPAAPEAK